MPSPRILTATALIERDTAGSPDETGEIVPGWTTVAAAEPCAEAQPMTDQLARELGGDVRVTDYWTLTGIGADVLEGDRFTEGGVAYRVQAMRPWRSGTPRARSKQIALRVL